MKIGLVYDLRSEYLAQGYSELAVAEFDSDVTIVALEQTIAGLGYATDRIGNARALCARLVRGDRWDLVFSIAEGLGGRARESQVPCILDLYGIPYTFSDPLVLALTLDKAITKRVVRSFGLVTPAFALVESPDDIRLADSLTYPLFAKPVAEGTGKGVDADSRVDSPAALRRVVTKLLQNFRQSVLVEEYLPGREFTTAMLGTGPDAKVIGSMEVLIKPDAPAQDYSYVVKEQCEQFVEYRPLREPGLREAVESLALQAHRVLQCRDASRADIRLDSAGRPSFIEINPLPGLHPHHSDLPIIAAQQSISFQEIIQTILSSALRRMPS